MSSLTPKEIDRNTVIKVLIEARQIPSGSVVSKRTGEQKFTLHHSLNIHKYEVQGCVIEDGAPSQIEGYFIVSKTSVSQVHPKTILCWHIRACEFVGLLQTSWTEDK